MLLLVSVLISTPVRSGAAVYLSQSEALEQAFPDASRIERHTWVLTEPQVEQIQALARAPLPSRLVTVHTGFAGGERMGYALIDVHIVRTLPEALMVVLTPGGAVRSVRLLAFHEPTDYQPPERWYRQFDGGELGSGLQLQRGIHAIAGATLSARAATRSVRLALAAYRVLLAPTQEKDPAQEDE